MSTSGFGWVRRFKVEQEIGGCPYPHKIWPRSVRYVNGTYGIISSFKPDQWYWMGPYTIVAWRPY